VRTRQFYVRLTKIIRAAFIVNLLRLVPSLGLLPPLCWVICTLMTFNLTSTSPLSRRLSRPPAPICAKPASRPRKLRLGRGLAEKNIRLSRRENCGLNTEKSTINLFPRVIRQSPRPAWSSLVGAVMFYSYLCIKRT